MQKKSYADGYSIDEVELNGSKTKMVIDGIPEEGQNDSNTMNNPLMFI